MDSASKYKLLLTFTSKGAAMAYAELNSPHYLDVFDKEGYVYQNMGYLGNVFAEVPAPAVDLKTLLAQADASQQGAAPQAAPENANKCVVVVVPEGTPAQAAGLQVGDEIVKCNDLAIKNRKELNSIFHLPNLFSSLLYFMKTGLT